MIRRRARGRSPEPEPATTPIWRRIDLHLHTPGSSDYQEPDATYLDILHQAEARGLDIIAFTDHNSVAGYAALREEVARLEFLEERARLLPDEAARLAEYRRLASRMLILPGFEFTATFGFHILGIFPETTTVRKLEHLLLALNVPEEKLARGSSEVGATADVLTAYEVIAEAGGLVIGAHVNSTHGVAMVGLGLGGQTKIAYTQDENLHALEVTDLDSANRRSTARFFNGAKSEYPRQMHCIQGSDAHRVERDPRRPDKNLGIGDRCTEVLLPDVTFAALKDLFTSNDFSRVRPYLPSADPFQALLAARQDGDSAVNAFREAPAPGSPAFDELLRDVVGFANTNGGVIYVGASPSTTAPIRGVEQPTEVADQLHALVARAIAPPLPLQVDTLTGEGKVVLAVTVPRGRDRPYALEPGYIFIRREMKTVLAPRDEIVRMVQATLGGESEAPPDGELDPDESIAATLPAASLVPRASAGLVRTPAAPEQREDSAPATARHERLPVPRTGVEIVSTVERNGVPAHTVRDLRNRRVIRNVTRSSATRLWRYAVIQREENQLKLNAVRWDERDPRLGYWTGFVQPEGIRRYNLVYHEPAPAGGEEPTLRVFYGVTEDGVDERWKALLPLTAMLPTVDFDQLPGELLEEPSVAASAERAVADAGAAGAARPNAPVAPERPQATATVPTWSRRYSDPPRSELAAHAPTALAPAPVEPASAYATTLSADESATDRAVGSGGPPSGQSNIATAKETTPVTGTAPKRRRAPRKPGPAAAPEGQRGDQARPPETSGGDPVTGVKPGPTPPAALPASAGAVSAAAEPVLESSLLNASGAPSAGAAPATALRRRAPARRRAATTSARSSDAVATASAPPRVGKGAGAAVKSSAGGGDLQGH